MLLCTSCTSALKPSSRRILPQALVNGIWSGPIPIELASLNEAEQTVIALNRVCNKSFFFLRASEEQARQRASKGHWVSWPQDAQTSLPVFRVPLEPSTLADTHVSFVGPIPFSEVAMKKTFSVSITKLKAAYDWLRNRNHLYANVVWDEATAALYTDGEVPQSVQPTFVQSDKEDRKERSGYVPRYDEYEHDMGNRLDQDDEDDSETDMIVERSGVVDTEGLQGGRRERQLNALSNNDHSEFRCLFVCLFPCVHFSPCRFYIFESNTHI